MSWVGITSFTQYIKIFKHIKNKTIINYIPQEHSPAMEYSWYEDHNVRAVEEALTKNNNKLIHILGGFHGCKPDLESMENTKVVYWPSYWVHHTYYNLDFAINEDSSKIYKDKLFVCLNGRPHAHRAMLIDELAKQNLLSDGYVSWHSSFDKTSKAEHFCDYDFKYFDGEAIIPDGDIKNSNQYNPPEFFDKGLVNLVAETSTDKPFITEKTIVPIFRKKPFLVLGCQYWYKALQSLGFRLYSEIFDYSFDIEPDLDVRIEMITDNIKKLQGMDYQEVYEKVLPVAEYNYYVASKIVKGKDPWLPKDLLTTINIDLKNNRNGIVLLEQENVIREVLNRV